MIKKLLLILLLMVTATVTMAAQVTPEVTAMPVITVEEPQDGSVTILVTCDEPAEIHVLVNGEDYGSNYGEFIILFPQGDYEQTVYVEAYAVADGKSPSPTVVMQCDIPALPMTAMPVITVEEPQDGIVTVHVTCDEPAEIHVLVNGEDYGISYGEFIMEFPQDYEEQIFYIEAYAVADGKIPSDHVVTECVIPALPQQTSMPNIMLEMNGYSATVYIENTDDNPDAIIYYRLIDVQYGVEDEVFYEYTGPFTIENCHYEEEFWRVEAYAIADGKLPSEMVGYEFMLYPDEPYSPDPYQVSCYDFYNDGIYYKILSDSTVGVTKQYRDSRHYNYWLGDVLCSYGNDYACYSNDVTVPATVTYSGNTYTVVAIMEEAFMKSSVTSVSLPSTITQIGDYAFAGSEIGAIDLPASVTSIGKGAFAGCTGLTAVAIPASATSLGDYAFSHCENVTSLTVNGAFPAIGKYGFSNCKKITQVELPATLTEIGDHAFHGCTRLASVTMPAGLETIGIQSFVGCTALTQMVLPASVKAIGNSAFSQCENLTSVSLGSALTTIGASAFSRCTRLTDITVPQSVTAIGNSAFYGCKSLETAVLPSGLGAIEYSTFLGCTSLSQVNLPAALTSISYDAFNGCKSLPGIAIPAGVTAIAARAFDDCPSLASIQVEQGNTVYDSRENCNAIIETATGTLLLGCKNTAVPDGITAIGDHAFYNCGDLTSVTIPEGVTTIGNYAFYNCKALTQVTLPSTIETICSDAFYTCIGLQTVTSLAIVPPAASYRTFISCYDATLRVKRESIEAYRAAEYWNQFKHILSTTDPDVGDIDGDGMITIADATALIDMLLSGEEMPAYADVDGNGTVSIADITALIDMLLNGN